ncbi:MAG TPA: methyltransferase domain-containing protein [Pirellulales bacterium]|nr:methyltransferase domain-containing protein [Pirellulales bacterium]
MLKLVRRTLRPEWRAWNAARYAGRLALARRALRRFAPPYKINAGCGPIPFAGWVNIDNNRELDTVDLFWDLSQGLPTPDATCEVVFSEHVLEHLSLQQGLSFLRDCRRSLVSGGVLRIAMPSLDDMIEKSASGNWRDQSWLHEPQWQFIASRAEMFNIMFRWWGHQWIYDREELHRRLREAGFETVRDVAWGESAAECLRNRETRPSSLLICEAVKTSPP